MRATKHSNKPKGAPEDWSEQDRALGYRVLTDTPHGILWENREGDFMVRNRDRYGLLGNCISGYQTEIEARAALRRFRVSSETQVRFAEEA